MIRISLVFMLFVLCLSCGRHSNIGDQITEVNDADFLRQDVSCEDCTPVFPDSLVLLSPGEIKYHPDSLLLIRESRGDRQILAVDMKTGQIFSFLNRGRAENELIMLRDLTVTGTGLCLSSMIESKILKMKFDRIQRRFVTDISIQTSPVQFLRALPIRNDYLILSSAYSGNRMNLIDKAGTVIDTVGNFPVLGITGGDMINNSVMQSDLCVSKDGDRIVSAYKTIDYIDIYDDEFNIVRRLRGPDYFEINIERQSVGNGYRTVQDPVCFTYNNIAETEDGFAVGYSGAVVKNDEILSDGFDTIYTFTWDGEPEKVYKLDFRITAFDIDRESGIAYCITSEEVPGVVCFGLF